jgi:hypothetical protein
MRARARASEQAGLTCTRHCHALAAPPARRARSASAGSMFAPRRPDKSAAYAQLRRHLALLAAWCGAVRAAPYVLDMLQGAE